MKKFEILFNEINDALFLHDFEGNLLKVNDHACERFGYTKDEFLSMNITEFAHDDILENWEARIKKIKKEGLISFETTYISKEGQLLDVEIVSKLITLNNKTLVLSNGRDISKRKDYEFQLKKAQKIAEENEYELRTIFNKAPSTILVFDEDSRIVRVNQKGIINFNVDESDLVNKRIGDVINCANTIYEGVSCGFSDSCLKCNLAKILRNTILLDKEYNKEEVTIDVLQNDITTKKTILISTSFLKKNGKNTYLATIDDITSRKQMELDLIAAKEKAEESEKLKSAFLNNISHEIRTPLNGILGFIEFLEDDNSSFTKEEKLGFKEIVRKSGDRLINTVTDLVEVSKLDSGIEALTEEEVNICDELFSFVNEKRFNSENPEILFDFEIDSNIKNNLFLLDKVKLFQILKNLINNAFKFTEKGWIKLVVTQKESEFVFTVEDSGVGIDSKYWDFIYEPFRQADLGYSRVYDGNGLGLTIAKKMVDKIGGKIWFESEVGKGTKFHFTCPIKKAYKTETVSQKLFTSQKELKLSEKKILIAEDEVTNYLLFKSFLFNYGCELVHAENGKEAVEIFEQNPSFDLIIMDLKMPLMDGIEATRKIKSIRNDVPVVAYSAYALDRAKQKAFDAGCVDYLTKPVDKESVINTIVNIFARQENITNAVKTK